MKCANCGNNVTMLFGNMCQGCFHESNIFYNQKENYDYNYKCPECKGEFNQPHIDAVSTTGTGNPKCPWCGKKMLGLL